MLITIVTIILWVAAVYLICGAVFTTLFLLRGIQVIDEGTHGATIGFRIIIIPGCVVLWPFLLRKWLSALKQPLTDQP